MNELEHYSLYYRQAAQTSSNTESVVCKMTSRLKHKLELENVNLKSAYLNESFVQESDPLRLA